MAAAALALEGWDVCFLGADTPAEVISSMAQALGAQAIALGSSPAADADGLAAQIRALREGVGENMAIWLGGASVPAEAMGQVQGVSNIAQLLERARSLRQGLRRRQRG